MDRCRRKSDAQPRDRPRPRPHARPGSTRARSSKRLRLRTLVALGVLAVATALLGRTFGLRDITFIGSEIGLLAAMFVVLRYVLPLVERHDRGATGEEQVGSLLDGLGRRLARDPRREPRQRQRRPHPDRAGGRVHGRDQEQSRPSAGRAHARRDAQPGPGPAQGDRARDGHGGASRCSSTAAPGWTVRWPGARA